MQCLQKPSDNPATFDFLHCHNHLLTEGAALIKWEPHSPLEKGKNIGYLKPEQPAFLPEGTGAVKSHWTIPVSEVC